MGGGDLKLFRDAKAGEIEALKEKGAEALLAEAFEFLEKRRAALGEKPSFREALEKGAEKRGLALIAEYKRASTSLGDIELGTAPEEIPALYAEADAISVLTEEKYFKGSFSFIGPVASGGKPVLRKDFILHPLQAYATAATEASAILLIARLVPSVAELRSLVNASQSLGLAPVAEVFGAGDLESASAAGADIIQVNARDLETFKVDFLGSLRLIEALPPRGNEIFIAASGVRDALDLRLARKAGFRAALVGTALMKGGAPGERLGELLAGLEEGREP